MLRAKTPVRAGRNCSWYLQLYQCVPYSSIVLRKTNIVFPAGFPHFGYSVKNCKGHRIMIDADFISFQVATEGKGPEGIFNESLYLFQ